MSGYVIAQINMTNKEGFKIYAEQVPQTIKHYGGKYIIRAGEYKSLEGKWDYARNVIIEFPTYEKALEWYIQIYINQLKNSAKKILKVI